MPLEFYSGDSYAIKVEAVHLVRGGKFGIARDNAGLLGKFMDIPEQYFKLNESTGKYHNKWGLFNTLISSIPELVNAQRNERIYQGKTLAIDVPTILAHNIFNCLLSALLAVFLYKSASLFTRFKTIKILLLFTTLYASFTWNYMRTQSYEIVHLLLFTAFFYYYVVFLRAIDGSRKFISYRSFFLYNLCLAGLCLSKSYYFIIYPILFFAVFAKLVCKSNRGFADGIRNHWANFSMVILAGTITMLVYISFSYLYYGEIFFGHLSNNPEANQVALSYKFIPARLYDYLISNNRSLFVHMPLLIFGLAGFPLYVRRHRYEAWFLLGVFLFTFTFLSFYYTVGEWCYGPRLFLFMLPVLCLPAIYVFEMFIMRGRYAMLGVLSTALLVVSLVSLEAQMQMNSRRFFLRYELEELLGQEIGTPPELRNYFSHANFAVIARDTNKLLSGKPDGYLAEAYFKYIPKDEQDMMLSLLKTLISARFPGNYYFKTLSHQDNRERNN